MFKDPLEYLKHINDECLFILSVTDNDLTKNDIIQDELIKKSCF